MQIDEELTYTPVLIVGAGIAGLAAGRWLHDAGIGCRILEKSRGLGGRCATRRFDGGSFDHGAQFFTTRHRDLQVLSRKWLEQGQLREWCRGFPLSGSAQSGVDGCPRYCSSPGMNQLPKLLAGDLTIEKNILVTDIARNAHGWHVSSQCGRRWRSDFLVMTAPLPQTFALLGDLIRQQLLDRFPELASVGYDPCFTLMLALAGESTLGLPGAMREPAAGIDWIADNSIKHQTGGSAALTIHSGAEFTRHYFDAPHQRVAAAIIDAVHPWLGSKVESWQLQRWRYARPRNPLAVATLALDDTHPLVLSGDYLGAPARIEGAFDSGVAAARSILRQI
jgi:renalase